MSRDGENDIEAALSVCIVLVSSGALALPIMLVGSVGLVGAVCVEDISADACAGSIKEADWSYESSAVDVELIGFSAGIRQLVCSI